MNELNFDKLCKKIIVNGALGSSAITAYIQNGTNVWTNITELAIWRFNKFCEILIPYGYEGEINVRVLKTGYLPYTNKVHTDMITEKTISLKVKQKRVREQHPIERQYEEKRTELQRRIWMAQADGNRNTEMHLRNELYRLEQDFQTQIRETTGMVTSAQN